MKLFALRASSLALSALALSTLLAAPACSSSGGGTGGGGSSGSGGPVAGPMDTHCGATAQVVSPAACTPGNGGGGMGGAGGAGGGHGHEHEPEVMYNAEGDDDDCKYHMKWSVGSVAQNQDVTFTLELTTKSDGKPATGAAPNIEAFLSDTHPAPNSDQQPTEGQNGIYTIGPLRFDAAGKWTVRFHVYDTCADLDEASPHGHGAFYLQVP